MNTYIFSEWSFSKKIEEALRHAHQRTGRAPAQPEKGDLVITNALGFMNGLITKKRGTLKNNGKTKISKSQISKGSIIGLKDGKPVLRILSYGKKPIVTHPDTLLDVSPAFDDDFSGFEDMTSRQNVFLWNVDRQPNSQAGVQKSREKVEAMWSKWWSQVAPPTSGLNNVDAMFGGQDLAKQRQNSMADEEKHKLVRPAYQLVQALKNGESPPLNDGIINKIKDLVSDPNMVDFMMHNGYEDILSFMTQLGIQVPGYVAQPQTQSPLDRLLQPTGTATPEDPRMPDQMGILNKARMGNASRPNGLQVAHFDPFNSKFKQDVEYKKYAV